jgi:hypothetical protein
MTTSRPAKFLTTSTLGTALLVLIAVAQLQCGGSGSDVGGPDATATQVSSGGGGQNGGGSCPDFMPPESHTILKHDDGCSALHAPGYEHPLDNGCDGCHGADLTGDMGPSCFTCHGAEWNGDGDDDHGDCDGDHGDDDDHDGDHHGGGDDDDHGGEGHGGK